MSPTAGVICLAKPGEWVEEGQPVLELRADDPARFGPAFEALAGAVETGPAPPPPAGAVIGRVGT